MDNIKNRYFYQSDISNSITSNLSINTIKKTVLASIASISDSSAIESDLVEDIDRSRDKEALRK